jgi:CTP:molybdopterin cytidylyltransferase MocA
MTAPGSVSGIVLAAGAGRRMGQPKATVVVGGRTLLDRALDMLAAAGCGPLIAVLGASAVPPDPRDDTTYVRNPDWATGMASSLQVGLRAASGSAAVVALVDQPGITPEAVRRLITAAAAGRAVAAGFGGALRTPVLFDAALWEEVAGSVSGDAGARHWLRAHPDRVIAVACDDVADPSDLDDPTDLTRWERQWS